jgi:hypothetical protein
MFREKTPMLGRTFRLDTSAGFGKRASMHACRTDADIQSAINYDFAGHFGVPLGSLAARAVEIDRALRSWLDRHPEGIIVSLGEGLGTQSRRVDNGRMRWLTVDLPDAIRLREHFLNPPFPPQRSECARPCLDGRGRALVRRFHRSSGITDVPCAGESGILERAPEVKTAELRDLRKTLQRSPSRTCSIHSLTRGNRNPRMN